MSVMKKDGIDPRHGNRRESQTGCPPFSKGGWGDLQVKHSCARISRYSPEFDQGIRWRRQAVVGRGVSKRQGCCIEGNDAASSSGRGQGKENKPTMGHGSVCSVALYGRRNFVGDKPRRYLG